MTTHTIPVSGMTCGHCEGSVRDALARVPGVQVQAVDRDAAQATVQAPESVSRKQLAAAIEDIGFDVDPAWASA